MSNRKYIDQIKMSIESQLDEHKSTSKYVTREFFESKELKNVAQNTLKTIINAFKWPTIDDHSFDIFFSVALKEVRDINSTDILPSISLRKTDEDSWLTPNRQRELGWDSDMLTNYRNRYIQYLKSLGRAPKYIEETKRSSLEIVKKLGNPNSEKEFLIKGLVVGSVQSGKTANFNGVINSSIDCGYKLIIVLSGLMEDLRRQTQARIEKEVVGYSKSAAGFVGVGKIQPFGEQGDSSVVQIVIPTSMKVDFKKTIKEADFTLNNKNILVCKKNTGVLKNLLLWLSDYLSENKEKHDIPLLILDDEADNASLNNMGKNGKDEASIINGHLRALLGLFNRRSYLGYTATPFANVLQDKNEASEEKWIVSYTEKGETKSKEFTQISNLFPEDFIELLFPPSNYIGAKHFFETRIDDVKKIEPLIEIIPQKDHVDCFPDRVFKDSKQPTQNKEKGTRPSNKDDGYPKQIPESLKEAIMCFIVSIAIRLSRKEEMHDSVLRQPHNTMLIHISRFTNWQNQTKKLIKKWIDESIIEGLNNDLPTSDNSIYSRFELIWNRYYAGIIQNISTYLPDNYDDKFLTKRSFDEIKVLLVDAVKYIEVVAVNNESGDELHYPEKSEKKYIAIGGNKLSRGFTLEGLTINYFTRNTGYADTLLQMGRWFGYRPGYIDCCKLFTTSDSIEKFDLTTITIEELEHEFQEMKRRKRTPAQFRLWVRSNPNVIKVTRSSITKGVLEKKVDFSGGIKQSTKFAIDKDQIHKSWKSFESLTNSKTWKIHDNQNFFIHETNSKGLIEFLEIENCFVDFETTGVKEYLKACNEKGKLLNWTVAIKRNLGAQDKIEVSPKIDCLPEQMFFTIRRGPKPDPENKVSRELLINQNIFRASGKSANLVSSGEDFSITLPDPNRAKEEFYAEKIKTFLESKMGPKEADEKARAIKTIPDKFFRRHLDESEGILMIYVIDTQQIFVPEKDKKDEELLEYKQLKSIDSTTPPLIGYALGFPTISGDIGGTYISSNIDLEDEDTEDEYFESSIDVD